MERFFEKSLRSRWKDHKNLIQIFMGPRQVGKTTTALTLHHEAYSLYVTADSPTPPDTRFVIESWKKARQIDHPEKTLIIDEIQKIPRWSEVVKMLWDEDRRLGLNMRVCLLGSSALMIEKGLSESLTGRFEVNYFPHWSFCEVNQLVPDKKIDISTYYRLGGYPKAYDFLSERERARAYLESSVIEPALGRDILSLHQVDKPALLRQLFWFVSRVPCHIVSFDKILGHLQDRGNSATLSHYAELLKLAFLVVPIYKFSKIAHRTKKSLPKWVFPNPALIDQEYNEEGFLFENLVGSHILNLCYGKKGDELKYWRERNQEVDFVITRKNTPLLAIEVKSGRKKKILPKDALSDAGFSCPFLVVHQGNLNEFLRCQSLDEMSQLVL